MIKNKARNIFKKTIIVIIAIVMLFGTLAINSGCGNIYPRPNLNVDSELEVAIEQSFFEKHGIRTDDSFSLFYYGTYNETSVVQIESGYLAGAAVMTRIRIGGVRFTFSSTNIFIAWRNGDFYEVLQAYENNFLTGSQLRTIRLIHNER